MEVSMCDVATTYQVAGMTCDCCATKVTTAVSKVAGVTGAAVDLEKATVTVNGHVDDRAVSAAIADAGFTATRE